MRALVLVLVAACADPASTTPWPFDLPASLPPPPVPADNPMTVEKVELGRHLFYDTRLSSNGTQACASCHAQERAFTDGRTVSIGAAGAHGTRNALGLANVAYRASLTWEDHTVRSLEAQALVPMFSPIELGLPDEDALLGRLAPYADEFAAAFPDDAAPLSLPNIARALASFERTILSGSSRFDTHELTAAEQRGLDRFDALGCGDCHAGFDFTTASDGELRMFDSATGAPGKFRPPSLRNVAVTAPYFHDGSAATLDDVLARYEVPVADRADLIAFLAALTDEALLTNPALTAP